MPSYGNGANCDKLWRAWYLILITALNAFLIYVGITRYLAFKSQAFDPKFGGDWDLSGLNFTLCMLIGAMTCVCLFLFVSSVRTSNYANEGTQIGRDTNNLCMLTSPNPYLGSYQMINYSQNGAAYVHGSTGSGGSLVKRPDFTHLTLDEERLSSANVGEDTLPLGAFDTWPGTDLTNGNQCMRPNNGSSHLGLKQSVLLLWRRFQRHFLPYAVTLHLLAAVCFVLPIPLLHAQQIYHRALTLDWIWKSDLDILFGSAYPKHVVLVPSHGSVPQDVNKPEQLKTVELNANDGLNTNWDNFSAISPEFFNLALALLLLALRYPSVFWFTNKTFSFVFSLLLLLAGVHTLVEYCAVSVLVKAIWNRAAVAGLNELRLTTTPYRIGLAKHLPDPKSPDQVSQTLRSENDDQVQQQQQEQTHQITHDLFIQSLCPLTLSTVGTLLLLVLHITIFEYGYAQFTENLSAYRHFLSTQEPCTPGTESGERKLNGNSNGFGVVYARPESVHSGPVSKVDSCVRTDSRGPSKRRFYGIGSEILHPMARACLYKYAPHIGSLIGIIVVLAFKAPIMWDCMQVYYVTKHPLLLTSPLCTIIVMSVWFIAWFAFSLKPSWKFQVNLPLHTVTSIPMSTNTTDRFTLLQSSVPEINGQMIGSLIRPNSLGLYHRDVNGSNPAGPFIPNGGVAGATAPFLSDETPIQPSSPIYACFHDPTTGYVGVAQRINHHAPHLDGRDTGCPDLTGFLARQTSGTGTEDLEASSGRQSRNNYVCLQTATNGLLAPNIAVSMENGIFLTRLEASTNSSQAVLPNCSTVFASHEPLTMLASSSSPDKSRMDEHCEPMHLGQVNAFSRADGSAAGQTHNLGPYGALTINRYFSRQLSGRNNNNKNQNSPTQLVGGGPFLSSIFPSGVPPSLPELGQPTVSTSGTNDGTSHETSLDPASLIPRVTFKENVHVIAHGSPIVSIQSSASNSTSGESKLDCCPKQPDIPAPSSAPSDSSGTYDNAFSTGFRSSVAMRGTGRSIVDRELPSTLQRSNPGDRLANRLMNGSLHSPRLSPFSLNGGAAGNSGTGELNTFGQTMASPKTSTSTAPEMIGDTNASFQASATEDNFPSVLASCLISDDLPEPRLCSQV